MQGPILLNKRRRLLSPLFITSASFNGDTFRQLASLNKARKAPWKPTSAHWFPVDNQPTAGQINNKSFVDASARKRQMKTCSHQSSCRSCDWVMWPVVHELRHAILRGRHSFIPAANKWKRSHRTYNQSNRTRNNSKKRRKMKRNEPTSKRHRLMEHSYRLLLISPNFKLMAAFPPPFFITPIIVINNGKNTNLSPISTRRQLLATWAHCNTRKDTAN